jgi:hypothetical protein
MGDAQERSDVTTANQKRKNVCVNNLLIAQKLVWSTLDTCGPFCMKQAQKIMCGSEQTPRS